MDCSDAPRCCFPGWLCEAKKIPGSEKESNHYFGERFRGRELAHADIGKGVLDRVVTNLGDTVVVEQTPKLEGRSMTMILAPK